MSYAHLYPPRTDLPAPGQADVYCTTQLMEHMRAMATVEPLRRRRMAELAAQLQGAGCAPQADEPIDEPAEAPEPGEEQPEGSESSMSLRGRPGSDDSSTAGDEPQDDI